MISRLPKTLIYLNFDPMGVSRARNLQLKHQKIFYFRHFVHGRKLPDDMNKSLMLNFKTNFLVKFSPIITKNFKDAF